LIPFARQEIGRSVADHRKRNQPLKLLFALDLKCHDPGHQRDGIKLADHRFYIGEASRDWVQRRKVARYRRDKSAEAAAISI
jgi:hypothetical protein